ncbi:hypothetical protein B0H10DRAFT_2369002, partial [Mycena sp. CBHHK59/15]
LETLPSDIEVRPISLYTLNTEQARGFRLIADHSLEKRDQPLRMFLGGPGGTEVQSSKCTHQLFHKEVPGTSVPLGVIHRSRSGGTECFGDDFTCSLEPGTEIKIGARPAEI